MLTVLNKAGLKHSYDVFVIDLTSGMFKRVNLKIYETKMRFKKDTIGFFQTELLSIARTRELVDEANEMRASMGYAGRFSVVPGVHLGDVIFRVEFA